MCDTLAALFLSFFLSVNVKASALITSQAFVGKITPGLLMLVCGIFIFLSASIFGVFLIIRVPVFAVDFLAALAIGFGKLGTSSIIATSSFVNLKSEGSVIRLSISQACFSVIGVIFPSASCIWSMPT